MSAVATRWVDGLDLPKTERAIMHYLARKVAKGRTFIDVNFRYLGKLTDLVQESLSRAIARLCGKGLVRKHRERRADGTFGPLVLELCPDGGLDVIERHVRDVKALAQFERYEAVRAARAGAGKRAVARIMASVTPRVAAMEAHLEGVLTRFMSAKPPVSHMTFSGVQPHDVLVLQNVAHIDTRDAGVFSVQESYGLPPSDRPDGEDLTADDWDRAHGWSR